MRWMMFERRPAAETQKTSATATAKYSATVTAKSRFMKALIPRELTCPTNSQYQIDMQCHLSRSRLESADDISKSELIGKQR